MLKKRLTLTFNEDQLEVYEKLKSYRYPSRVVIKLVEEHLLQDSTTGLTKEIKDYIDEQLSLKLRGNIVIQNSSSVTAKVEVSQDTSDEDMLQSVNQFDFDI